MVEAGGSLIHDTLPPDVNKPLAAPELGFRVLSARRLPDALMMTKTIAARNRADALPAGLEICVALGSPVAVDLLNDPDKEAVLREVKRTKPAFDRSSLYCRQLDCLSALLDAADPAAPPLFSSQPWQTKSCQTVLASWAQARHTWILQAEQPFGFAGGIPDRNPGYVEPDPEFFARLADLIDRGAKLLRERGVLDEKVTEGTDFENPSLPKLENYWAKLQDICRRLEALAHKQLRGLPFNEREANFLEDFGVHLSQLVCFNFVRGWRPGDGETVITDVMYGARGGNHLLVGAGRPHALYVLYPVADKEVLCRGVALSYYEFPSPVRMTDAEWREKLKSKKPPTRPAWTESLYADGPPPPPPPRKKRQGDGVF
jgi:hypothetical protein